MAILLTFHANTQRFWRTIALARLRQGPACHVFGNRHTEEVQYRRADVHELRALYLPFYIGIVENNYSLHGMHRIVRASVVFL